ncbi:hypothetical protein [Fictibacillus nanhaiensis]|uniref:hypothetical protein n=1 Tax=Fictibacillus nanhaiensis TaxID=742169 RepID=UPI003C1314FF
MNKHLLRKMKSALLASFLLTMLLGLYLVYESGSAEGSLALVIVYLFALAGNFFYGIPASLLIDLLMKKIDRFHFWLSGFLHIFFAIICATLFFLSEEWQKGEKHNLN